MRKLTGASCLRCCSLFPLWGDGLPRSRGLHSIPDCVVQATHRPDKMDMDRNTRHLPRTKAGILPSTPTSRKTIHPVCNMFYIFTRPTERCLHLRPTESKLCRVRARTVYCRHCTQNIVSFTKLYRGLGMPTASAGWGGGGPRPESAAVRGTIEHA